MPHYSVMEEGLRFSHLKKCTFFVTTAFLEILVLFSEPHRLHNQQLKKFNKKDPSSQKQITLSLPLPSFIILQDFLSPSFFGKFLSGGARLLEIATLQRTNLRDFSVGLGDNGNEI